MDILELINVESQQNANKQHRCEAPNCNKAFGEWLVHETKKKSTSRHKAKCYLLFWQVVVLTLHDTDEFIPMSGKTMTSLCLYSSSSSRPCLTFLLQTICVSRRWMWQELHSGKKGGFAYGGVERGSIVCVGVFVRVHHYKGWQGHDDDEGGGGARVNDIDMYIF